MIGAIILQGMHFLAPKSIMVTIPLTGKLLNSLAPAILNTGIDKNKHIKRVRQIFNRSFFTKSSPYPQQELWLTVTTQFSKVYYLQTDLTAAFTFRISSAIRLKSLFFSNPAPSVPGNFLLRFPHAPESLLHSPLHIRQWPPLPKSHTRKAKGF